jgi:single-strand DNA-binding protein
MNTVNLIGRITKDLELKTTTSGVAVCSFTLAVNRKFKNAEGEYDTDFINCVAWRKQAELICKHFSKGSQIGITGNIQTRNYENDNGKKIYITEVMIDELTFIGKKEQSAEQIQEPAEGFAPITPDDNLPF